jgi:hypothetical protein
LGVIRSLTSMEPPWFGYRSVRMPPENAPASRALGGASMPGCGNPPLPLSPGRTGRGLSSPFIITRSGGKDSAGSSSPGCQEPTNDMVFLFGLIITRESGEYSRQSSRPEQRTGKGPVFRRPGSPMRTAFCCRRNFACLHRIKRPAMPAMNCRGRIGASAATAALAGPATTQERLRNIARIPIRTTSALSIIVRR